MNPHTPLRRRLRRTLATTLVSGLVTALAGSAVATTGPAATPSALDGDCPYSDGGLCVGELEPNHPYTTDWFVPQLTYQVDRRGWFNWEDWPGNFLLVPPGNDLEGVNLGTSDFISVFTRLEPSHLVDPQDCVIETDPGDWDTPQAIADHFRADPDLRTSRPQPATIGGLGGLVITMSVRPEAELDTCSFDDGTTFELAGLFSGVRPSSFDHSVLRGVRVRLYLLSFNGHVMGVELDNVDVGRGGMGRLDRVAQGMSFWRA